VKFLCDRCKTRYSIGDDRVRGKILKIRCKNCANVITVREGMTDADVAAENGAPRRNKVTTSSPPIASAQPAPANGSNGSGHSALGAAFASAMTAKPPPALEEEWYVSIDGEQEGPFSLSDAQRWVAAKPFEAELHCWSEGFDDWLPVDKVSHFRGLRKKPLPQPAPPVHAAPPPLPRLGGIKPIIPPDENTPKPLFAATMAALEKNAPHPVAPSHGVGGLPSIGNTLRGQVPAPSTPASTRGTPSAGHGALQARSNGAGLASTALGRATPVPSIANNPARMTSPAIAAKPALGSIPPAGAFDESDSAASKTQIEAPPFEDEAFARPAPSPRPAPAAPAREDSDGDLDIGEVSRVVKLADIVPTKQPRRDVTGPVARRSGWIPQAQLDRLTASVPKMDMPADGQVRNATGALNVMPASDLAAKPMTAHKRGLLILLGVAVILLGVAAAVLFVILNDDDAPETTLSEVKQLNTERPDVDVRHPMIPGTSVPVPVPTQPTRPRRPNPGQNVQPRQPIEDETPGPNKLDPSEVEQMALKQSSSTNFCYTRALRGKGAIELADLKKITATLSIDKEGVVSSSQLSDHNDDALGSCINRVIRGWHFRQASGGTFRITLQFVNI
jgi:predicted Zn finger-like uncharacterized protein